MKEVKKSVVVGLTGGIGSGKSSVANILNKKGIITISTDIIAKELMANDNEIKTKLIEAFGEDTYASDGNVNKAKLAKIVFGTDESSRTNLDRLNQIVHPPVIDKMIELVDKHENLGEQIIVVESALIYEAGLDDGFDYLISVIADEEIVVNRICDRLGISNDEALARIKSQMSPKEKADMSDFVIENNSSFEDLIKAVEFVHSVLMSL